MPVRIQRKRTKGWTMPPHTIYVGRPTKWGNPFTVDGGWIVWVAVALGFNGNLDGRKRAAVELYRAWLTGVLPPIRRSDEDCGAFGYEDGTVVSVSDHVQGLAGRMCGIYDPPQLPASPSLGELRGKDLACWCPLGEPCHADVLLEIANKELV